MRCENSLTCHSLPLAHPPPHPLTPPTPTLPRSCRYMVDPSNSWYMGPAIAVASLFFKTPEQGSQTSIYLAGSKEVEGLNSKYWADCRTIASSPASYDTDVAARLFDLSAELTRAK